MCAGWSLDKQFTSFSEILFFDFDVVICESQIDNHLMLACPCRFYCTTLCWLSWILNLSPTHFFTILIESWYSQTLAQHLTASVTFGCEMNRDGSTPCKTSSTDWLAPQKATTCPEEEDIFLARARTAAPAAKSISTTRCRSNTTGRGVPPGCWYCQDMVSSAMLKVIF